MTPEQVQATGPVPVLLNPRAGNRPTAPEALARTLENAGVTAEVETVNPDDLDRRVRDCAGRGLVAVAGGDGSQRTAANALLGARAALATIPAGRLNHFARRAGMDTVEAAARAIRAGHRTGIPVGRVGDEVFLDTAVVGAYPDLIRWRERLRSVITTWPAAAVASLLMLARWPRVSITVRSPGHEVRIRTAMLWVGVGHNSFPAPHQAPLPSPDDVLQVVILPGGRRAAATLARALLRYRREGHESLTGSGMTVMEVPWIELESPGPIPIALDGEPRSMRPPLRLELASEPLHLIVPAG